MSSAEPSLERLERLVETSTLEMHAGFAELRGQLGEVRGSVGELRLAVVERHAAVLERFDTMFGAIADLRAEYAQHTHPDPET